MLPRGGGQHPEPPARCQAWPKPRAGKFGPQLGVAEVYIAIKRREQTRGRGEEKRGLKRSKEQAAKAGVEAMWNRRDPRGRAGQSWLGSGGFAEPHGNEAGKAKADSEAHSKYIVPAELSLLSRS